MFADRLTSILGGAAVPSTARITVTVINSSNEKHPSASLRASRDMPTSLYIKNIRLFVIIIYPCPIFILDIMEGYAHMQIMSF